MLPPSWRSSPLLASLSHGMLADEFLDGGILEAAKIIGSDKGELPVLWRHGGRFDGLHLEMGRVVSEGRGVISNDQSRRSRMRVQGY